MILPAALGDFAAPCARISREAAAAGMGGKVMKLTSRLVSGAMVFAMAAPAPAWAGTGARTAPPAPRAGKSAVPAGKSVQQPAALSEAVVTGIRESMASALEIKRLADTIEDSIVASDIGKLPDATAIEALQRIPGIQIGRQLGEGGGTVTIGGSAVTSGYEIRGLPQAETTLNGREVFSAQGSRVLNLTDIPSALLAGIDVYKDPTADLLTGGIAGTVDLRTHKPFDFQGLKIEAGGEEQYGDLSGRFQPAFTGLVSDALHTGVGRVGGLLTLSYQDRAYREDNASNSAIATSIAAMPGRKVTYTNGVYNTMFIGDRRRIGVDGVLQWQPREDLRAYAEASSEDFDWRQNQYTFTTSGGTPVPGSMTLFPGTSDVQGITWANAAIGTVGAWRTVEDVNRQYALHATWTPAPWTVAADLSYTGATERLDNPAVKIGTTGILTQLSSIAGVTQSIVSGVDTSDLASYGGTTSDFQSYTYDTEQHFRGGETAGRLDVTYALPSGFITDLMAGVRIAGRMDAFNQWSNFGAITTVGIRGTSQWFGEVPLSPFYSATESVAVQPQFVVFNPDILHFNLAGVDRAYGVAPPLDSGSADYHVQEHDYAGYFRIDFGPRDWPIPLTGNVGLRLARHATDLSGELQSGQVHTPAAFATRETDALPSLNLTFRLLPDLQLRLGASRAVSYPDFSQIRPSISLLPAQGSASGGNPYLKPTKASQFDASLEWYFASGSALTGDVFYKKLTNFILQETEQDAFSIAGVTYNLTGASDGGSGSIKGLEIGYQQFYHELPGLLSGLGTQINYTYTSAAAPTAVAGQSTTLPGLSKNSCNVIGIYERGPVSLRLAYNWRSQFYTTIYNGANAQLAANPIYTKGYGWLDASLEYKVNGWLSLYAQGSNLLRTRITEFYGAQTLQQSQTIDDRRARLGLHARF